MRFRQFYPPLAGSPLPVSQLHTRIAVSFTLTLRAVTCSQARKRGPIAFLLTMLMYSGMVSITHSAEAWRAFHCGSL